MNKVKGVLPIVIVVIIGAFIMIKNTDIVKPKDSYVVSKAENNNREENQSKNQLDKDIESDKEVKTNELENTNYNKDQNENGLNGENYHVEDGKKITIYISGEVNSPGVVELESSDRLIDGVKLCEGLTNEADINNVNLAMKIQDEGHYVIPKIGENIQANTPDSNISTPQNNNNNDINSNSNPSSNQNDNNGNNSNKININNADIKQLDSLPGVGEVTAQKIIDYREENTKFKSIEEIKNVKGIGENKFNDLKDYISI